MAQVRGISGARALPAAAGGLLPRPAGQGVLQIDLEPYRVARLELERMSMDLSSVCDCAFALPQSWKSPKPTLRAGSSEAVRLRFL